MELKRGDRARVQTRIVEFIALPFSFSSKLKIWSFLVVVVRGQQRSQCTKKRDACADRGVALLIKPIAFFDVLLTVAVIVS